MKKLHFKATKNNENTSYNLAPLPGQQKSFYGKASVSCYDNIKVLYSYGTPVLALASCGVFYRLWGGYSVTTANHIKAFLGRHLPKAEWDKMAVCRWGYEKAEGYEGWGVFSGYND